MKFTKTAVALAIAGIAAAPMMATADTTLSGAVQIKLTATDADGDDPNIEAGDVLVGVVSEHALNSGLTGYGSLRIDIDSLSGGGTDTADNVYVGLKGGFGDVRFGEIPVAVEYGQLANDIHDVADAINGGMSYTGTFGGVTVGLNHAFEAPNEDVIGAGIKFAAAGFTIGAGFEDRAETEAMSVGASYGIGGFSLAAHLWTRGDDTEVVAAKVGYGIGNVSLGLTFSQAEDIADFESKIRFDAAYDLGGDLELSTRINVNADSPDSTTVDDMGVATTTSVEDLTDWRIQLSKSF